MTQNKLQNNLKNSEKDFKRVRKELGMNLERN